MKPTISIALITLGLRLCPPAQAVPEIKYLNKYSAISDCLSKAYCRPGIWIEGEKFVDARCVLDPKKKWSSCVKSLWPKNVLSGRDVAFYKATQLSCATTGDEHIHAEIHGCCAFRYTSPHGPVIEP